MQWEHFRIRRGKPSPEQETRDKALHVGQLAGKESEPGDRQADGFLCMITI